MKTFIHNLNAEAEKCGCGHVHTPIAMECTIASGAIGLIPDYLAEKGTRSVCVVADRNTYQAAGKELCERLGETNVHIQLCILPANRNGDVLADESSVVQLLLKVNGDTEILLAVGSGTIHDIVRFISSKINRPFLSVPTAASVDGFPSIGAPLIIQKVKKTVQAVPPIAIFADLDVLEKSPRPMTAAGFGDMLGKFTSLADWRFSKEMADEPFCPLAYRVTEESLNLCIRNLELISEGRKEGLRILMEALVQSGLSILLVGHSRPASGGEHHLSHMWEMDHLQADKPQLLHGAKVGVASVLLTRLYRKLAQMENREPFQHYLKLPDSEQMAAWLKKAGGPSTLEELGMNREETVRALKSAPELRDRYTGLRYIRDHYPSLLEEIVFTE